MKEQQKRIGSAEFRNTRFSYSVGLDGVEKFVATPELQSDDSIGPEPLKHGQVWAISPGGQDEAAGLSRIESVLWRNSLDIFATRAWPNTLAETRIRVYDRSIA